MCLDNPLANREISECKKSDVFFFSFFFFPDCEDCKSFFIIKCEIHGAAVFISDTPVPAGVTDRARLTLPLGLEVRRSEILGAGLGVFNEGETVPVGVHFGPYEGELVDREEAVNSGYSWVVSQFKKNKKL